MEITNKIHKHDSWPYWGNYNVIYALLRGKQKIPTYLLALKHSKMVIKHDRLLNRNYRNSIKTGNVAFTIPIWWELNEWMRKEKKF